MTIVCVSMLFRYNDELYVKRFIIKKRANLIWVEMYKRTKNEKNCLEGEF